MDWEKLIISHSFTVFTCLSHYFNVSFVAAYPSFLLYGLKKKGSTASRQNVFKDKDICWMKTEHTNKQSVQKFVLDYCWAARMAFIFFAKNFFQFLIQMTVNDVPSSKLRELNLKCTLRPLFHYFFLNFSRVRGEGKACTDVLKYCKFFCLLTEICKQGVWL